VGSAGELGGAYRPSPGLTPEIVFPFAFVVARQSGEGRPLSWVRLAEVLAHRDRLPDGHLRIGALRAAHALA
jgi:hypothetical protein